MRTINLTTDEECKLFSLVRYELKESIKKKKKYEKRLRKNMIPEERIDTVKLVISYLDENIKAYRDIYNKLK
ncbi:hypothetical protein [Intestinibacter sp.]|uniref:hypothetical protein n=1 Tax=Intestinibacter sp. TaxID=1965304 RepID=UPI002A757853|nr:hypothetical protein [Intestinibacter sp.]MDY2734895.1 hypothetical protein [Intestinibacter sp.]